ncbi:type II toxin-antitoxin system death-on-curing family toxin [Lentilactobacillus sp. IMAU92037]|uniref:type II toxin-antitoxin system death-on-curing family toxin n=1 Tax=Lentilactobacillus TaxID=2767893 RepID=UPI001C254271|nr:type II toxin-antitoxin system death-on-curing family toxin [Lentilactobacillus sp. TOM.63]MBU9788121.1 type II toxin-antitoxin system death-on-curing family toxin [Lentilactobacillus dabitei]MBV0931257.1 type II toxin-antitoxin system death-on-curing family toxin [Lentilactobacillus dabitei]MDM7515169.1 type II toxin-antitoxin system death-on-curing family toxin [Lentilactobacillus sp. TOM.63]
MKLLSIDEIIAINVATTSQNGQKTFVRNPHGLESIVALPRQSAFGQQMYETLAEKIGITFIKIINLHPFEDGNKRTAVIAAEIISRRNHNELMMANDEIRDLALRVAKTDDSNLNYHDVYLQFERHLK